MSVCVCMCMLVSPENAVVFVHISVASVKRFKIADQVE